MEWTQIVGLLGVLLVVVSAVGAVVALATSGLFAAPFTLAAVVVVVIVAVVVGGMVLTGRRNSRWTDNPDSYW